MTPVFTPDAARRLDASCIEMGISEISLIRHASASAVEKIQQILLAEFGDRIQPLKVLVACGGGNNGADGLTIAGLLCLKHTVTVLCAPRGNRASPGYVQALAELPSQVVKLEYQEAAMVIPSAFDVVIDAVLGSGARLPLSEEVRYVVDLLSASKGLGIAIDIPTGLDALTGESDDVAFRAAHTITMEGLKPGLLRGMGPELCGHVHVVSIGAPPELTRAFCDGAVLDESDLISMLPVRRRISSKFDYGHVTVIGGSLGMRGAPSMTAHAALALGAGMVDLITPSVHPLTPREIMTTAVAHHEDGTITAESYACIMDRVKRATVVAIGPGLGSNPRTIAMLAELIEDLSSSVTVVLDADGIRTLPLLRRRECRLVITPHLGELARLLRRDRSELMLGYAEHAMHAAEEYSAVVHIKHVPAATCGKNHTTYLQRGNPAMASAGSGDVLTGIIAGIAAQGMQTYDAARCGAWLHAVAGDRIVRNTRKTSIMATELIDMAARLRGELTASRT